MDMEGLDSNNSTHNSIAKGKRTKRMRLLSPCGVLFDTTTTVTTVTSSTSSASSTTTFESEEEDMANCLILLAQGGESHHPPPPRHDKQQVERHGLENCVGVIKTEEKGNSNSNNVNATTTATTATAATNNTKVGFYIYECKSCNRTFPSFQALGGHRASHKKPKLAAEEKKQPLPPPPPQPLQPSAPSQLQHMIVTNYDRFEEGNVKSGPPISLQLGNNGNNKNKGKIHECSICGSEFTSGQALGGHMRRHRASTNTNTTVVDTTRYNTVTTTIVNTAQPRNILQLDLNLPAPEDDVREAKFHFATNQVLVGTPALVDCHY